MITGEQLALQAVSSKYDSITYDKYDCQAFVELVLRDCGVRTDTGAVYNWKGSNHMWRTALAWKGTIEDCKRYFGRIPVGSWVFMLSDDGGEVSRGYHDDEGNAVHVGIYCKPDSKNSVRDSTKGSKRNGVGYRPLSDFNRVGLPFMVNYNAVPTSVITKEEALQALEILTKYMKG